MAQRSKRKTTVTKQNELTVSPWKLDALQVEELRRKLAKRANQRLVRLERRKASSGESLAELGIAQYAYEQIRSIKAARNELLGDGVTLSSAGGGKLRFKESKLSTTDSEARRELYALQNFLSEETSKAGTAARYVSKTEQTFLERGISVGSYKSFYNFLNSSAFASLKDDGLDSNQIIELYNKAHDEGMSFKKLDKAVTDYLTSLENKKNKKPNMKALAKAWHTTLL